MVRANELLPQNWPDPAWEMKPVDSGALASLFAGIVVTNQATEI